MKYSHRHKIHPLYWNSLYHLSLKKEKKEEKKKKKISLLMILLSSRWDAYCFPHTYFFSNSRSDILGSSQSYCGRTVCCEENCFLRLNCFLRFVGGKNFVQQQWREGKPVLFVDRRLSDFALWPVHQVLPQHSHCKAGENWKLVWNLWRNLKKKKRQNFNT